MDIKKDYFLHFKNRKEAEILFENGNNPINSLFLFFKHYLRTNQVNLGMIRTSFLAYSVICGELETLGRISDDVSLTNFVNMLYLAHVRDKLDMVKYLIEKCYINEDIRKNCERYTIHYDSINVFKYLVEQRGIEYMINKYMVIILYYDSIKILKYLYEEFDAKKQCDEAIISVTKMLCLHSSTKVLEYIKENVEDADIITSPISPCFKHILKDPNVRAKLIYYFYTKSNYGFLLKEDKRVNVFDLNKYFINKINLNSVNVIEFLQNEKLLDINNLFINFSTILYSENVCHVEIMKYLFSLCENNFALYR